MTMFRKLAITFESFVTDSGQSVQMNKNVISAYKHFPPSWNFCKPYFCELVLGSLSDRVLNDSMESQDLKLSKEVPHTHLSHAITFPRFRASYLSLKQTLAILYTTLAALFHAVHPSCKT